MAKKRELFREVQVSFVRHWRLEEKVCLQCGKKFTGVRKQKYCSRACQNKANYERHTERYRQSRMEKYYSQKKSESAKKIKKPRFLSDLIKER